MVLAKFLCQAMACNFVILEKKIHKEKKKKFGDSGLKHQAIVFIPLYVLGIYFLVVGV